MTIRYEIILISNNRKVNNSKRARHDKLILKAEIQINCNWLECRCDTEDTDMGEADQCESGTHQRFRIFYHYILRLGTSKGTSWGTN